MTPKENADVERCGEWGLEKSNIGRFVFAKVNGNEENSTIIFPTKKKDHIGHIGM